MVASLLISSSSAAVAQLASFCSSAKFIAQQQAAVLFILT
jgi:hypothetical protein